MFVCLQKLFQGFKVSKFETAAQLREIATLSRETVQLTLVRVRVRTLIYYGFMTGSYYMITM